MASSQMRFHNDKLQSAPCPHRLKFGIRPPAMPIQCGCMVWPVLVFRKSLGCCGSNTARQSLPNKGDLAWAQRRPKGRPSRTIPLPPHSDVFSATTWATKSWAHAEQPHTKPSAQSHLGFNCSPFSYSKVLETQAANGVEGTTGLPASISSDSASRPLSLSPMCWVRSATVPSTTGSHAQEGHRPRSTPRPESRPRRFFNSGSSPCTLPTKPYTKPPCR